MRTNISSWSFVRFRLRTIKVHVFLWSCFCRRYEEEDKHSNQLIRSGRWSSDNQSELLLLLVERPSTKQSRCSALVEFEIHWHLHWNEIFSCWNRWHTVSDEDAATRKHRQQTGWEDATEICLHLGLLVEAPSQVNLWQHKVNGRVEDITPIQVFHEHVLVACIWTIRLIDKPRLRDFEAQFLGRWHSLAHHVENSASRKRSCSSVHWTARTRYTAFATRYSTFPLEITVKHSATALRIHS